MTLQGALQSITHSLPSIIVQPARSLLGDECYASLIYNVEPTSTCLRLALSKGLGIGIIIFGSILKLPQIATIVRNESAWGISLSMYALEVVAYDISLAYAFRKRLPFSTYGENASLTVQNMVITLLIIWYSPSTSISSDGSIPMNGNVQHQRNRSALLTRSASSSQAGFSHDKVDRKQNSRTVGWAACAMLAASIFLFLLCPSGLLSVLQAFSIPISLLSKFPQIAELHRNKECGHLSAIVVFAQLAGTLARVFTTVTETGDWLLGIGFGLASVLNSVIAAQYVYYWESKRSKATTTLPLTNAHPRSMSGKIWNSSTNGLTPKEIGIKRLN